MRRWLGLIAAALSLVVAGAAQAAYPEKPVRIIVPYIAGSAPDVLARQVAQRLTSGLGQQFIVDNKPGVAGNIGAEVAARAAPDGYTLLMFTSSHVLSRFLYARVNFDALKDFAPITMITRIPSLMVVPPSSPAKTVVEFIALAKSMPGKLNYGSGGVGTLAHLSAEAFRYAAGIDYVHVPYKGAPDIVLGLISNQVQVGFPTMPTAVRPALQGTLRPLAVTSARRTTAMPDVPTLLEAMPNGFDLDAWLGLAAPAGTPRDIVERVYATLAEALKDQAFRDVLGNDGSEIVINTPNDFAAVLKGESDKSEALIKRVGVRLE
ncbi:MAG: tripartite tricarboxylate transporter substrate binding protein [Enhydrobacter sp.]|nr:tripartite tricarboxylate transporter substrate binding protein [Enhydrobacter sp.]